jgi:hypothetical protein
MPVHRRDAKLAEETQRKEKKRRRKRLKRRLFSSLCVAFAGLRLCSEPGFYIFGFYSAQPQLVTIFLSSSFASFFGKSGFEKSGNGSLKI